MNAKSYIENIYGDVNFKKTIEFGDQEKLLWIMDDFAETKLNNLPKPDVNRSSCKCTTVVSVYKAYECTECGKLVKGI